MLQKSETWTTTGAKEPREWLARADSKLGKALKHYHHQPSSTTVHFHVTRLSSQRLVLMDCDILSPNTLPFRISELTRG